MYPSQIKAAVRERDGNRCTKCGMTNDQHRDKYHGRQLDVHRKTPGSRYALDDSCVTLCRKCHGPEPKSRKPRQPSKVIPAKFSTSVFQRLDRTARILAIDPSHLLRMIVAEKLIEYEERGQRAKGDNT